MSPLNIGKNKCYATLVGSTGTWALTAAHCFQEFTGNLTGHLSRFDRSFHGDAKHVRFHPKTWPNGEMEWKTPHPKATVTIAYDVALVLLSAPVTEHAPALLYHPAQPPALSGSLTFGGANTDQSSPEATGTEAIEGIASSPGLGGPVLVATLGTPSASVGGDSGGGAFFVLPPDAPPSVPPRFCMCRGDDGKPIDDPEVCKELPHFCLLDPLQLGLAETGSGQPPPTGKTYWHRITVDYGGGTVKGGAAAVTGDAGFNERLGKHGSVGGALLTPLDLPVPIVLPELPAFSAGAEDVDVPGSQALWLSPGAYGAVKLAAGTPAHPTVLRLTGGIYEVGELDLGSRSRLECLEVCQIRIAGRLLPGPHSFLGPGPGDPSPARLTVVVAGKNGKTGKLAAEPKAATIGIDSVVRARLYAPNGTLHLRHGTRASGGFVARDVLVGTGVVLDGGAS
jgi:hypothetical protein